MKKAICTYVVLAALAVFSHAEYETAQYVGEMVERIMLSPEWEDCPAAAATNEVEVLFPTMDSVFECDVSSNSCAFSMSPSERRIALKDYLEALAHTNRDAVSSECTRTGSYAILCCLDKGYTNVMPQVKGILIATNAPCKSAALSYVLGLSAPSEELNAVMLGALSDKMAVSFGERYRAMGDYARSLGKAKSTDASVYNDAAVLFYRGRSTVDNLRALDALLLAAYTEYENSSNRLLISNMALSRLDDKSPDFASALDREYFESITNRLLKASCPLSDVEALRGL